MMISNLSRRVVASSLKLTTIHFGGVANNYRTMSTTGFEEHTLNISEAVMKEDETASFVGLLGKPVSTLQGMGPKSSELANALGLKTVQDLADYKYFHWARSIKTLSETETEDGRSEGSRMNIDKMVDKAYETKTLKEIVNSPVAALQGLSDKAGSFLGGSPLNVTTVGDLASWKYCRWAEAIVVASKYEIDSDSDSDSDSTSDSDSKKKNSTGDSLST
mmetsp:Transcript_55741/g.63273  ORF Transcript_55741/g.63273 Transcript_55741/m.63273 type:complete len:219 (-) Transcript_55741:81-737(-)